MPPPWCCWTRATSSRRRPEAALRGALLAALALIPAACTPTPPSGRGLNKDALDDAIAEVIGDPDTCVLLADRATKQVVYRYGEHMTCARSLPACDRPGRLTAQDALAFAETPDGRTASCASNPEVTRGVAWAEGKVESDKRDLIYSAVMEGQRALPGREIAVRLREALAKAGV
ncbi:MAG TPA: hypothetical protein VFE03_05025 [Caulobacteraceae bacterium]|jgi:hypothetical protein|nr:hypothetical protein [Caulobacteraceae bacterium]